MNNIFPLVSPYIWAYLVCFGVRFNLYLASWSSDCDPFFSVCVVFGPLVFSPENGGGGQAPLAPPWIRAWTAAWSYHNLIVWRWRLFPHNTWDYLYSTARHPHGTRTTHLLTVGSPNDCRPATGDRSYGCLTIKLFQFLKGTARTS